VSTHHCTYARIPLTLEVHLQFKGDNLGHAFTLNIHSFGAFKELPKSELATYVFIKFFSTKIEPLIVWFKKVW
jgi:hypothetical protein